MTIKYINKNATKKFFPILIIFLTALFLLSIRQSIYVNIIDLPFDDGLFIAIAEGHILGNSSSLESVFGFNPLVKGVIYPWLITLSHFLYLNPLTFIYLLYILGIIFVTFNFIDNKFNKLLFFLFMVLQPLFFSFEGSRITRELAYATFILLSVILIRKLSYENRIKYIVIKSVFIGFFLAIVQNIREERSWVWIILVVSYLFSFIEIKNKKNIIFSLVFIILSYFSSTNLVKVFNFQIYGVYLANSTVEGEFPRLMKNLASIGPGLSHKTYVAIPKEKRLLAYDASSEFKKLEEYIEVDGRAWLQMGCDDVGICDDYTNGFFHVLLREAIVSNGYWDNQKMAQNYMRQVNLQLEKACSTGKLECSSGLPLASALGITKITKQEIYNSFNFLYKYTKNSIFDQSMIPNNLPAYQIMEERLWNRWSTVIPSLPKDQNEFRDKYNHRITLFYPIYKYLYLFHQAIVICGFIILALLLFRKNYLKNLIQNKNLFFTFNTANIFLLIWLTRGLIVSLNSATNFIGYSGRFAMPGQIFFSLAGILYLYIFVSLLKSGKEESNAR